MLRIIYSTFLCGLILFMWGGFTQLFPWGVSSTQIVVSMEGELPELYKDPRVIKLDPHEATTAEFKKHFVDKVSTYTTDDTFSWIITKPYSHYSMSRYFMYEVFTQLFVGVFLSLLLHMTNTNELMMRLSIVGIAGIMAAGIYLQFMNWWGLPLAYGVGASVNLVAGWLLAAYLSARFILKRELQA